MDNKRDNSTIQSLKIGIDIIEIVVNSKMPMKFADIKEKTQMTKSNLYKYMNTLTQLDILVRDPYSGLYYLGPKLIHYGAKALDNQDVLTMISPHMQEIVEHSGCTVILSIPTYNGPIIAKICRPQQTLNIGANIGTLLPANSSSGKIFNVFYKNQISDSEGKNENSLQLYTEGEINQIAAEKVAFSKEPLIESISSMSFPIFSHSNELIGIITVVGFLSEIPTSSNNDLSQYCLGKQREISRIFGHLEEVD